MVQCINADCGEYVDLYSSSMRKSRRDRRCCECQRWIDRGEMYEYAFTIFEGEPYSYATCTDCLAVGKALFLSRTYASGAMWTAIQMAFEESRLGKDFPIGALVDLPDWAQRRLAQLWDNAADKYGWMEE